MVRRRDAANVLVSNPEKGPYLNGSSRSGGNLIHRRIANQQSGHDVAMLDDARTTMSIRNLDITLRHDRRFGAAGRRNAHTISARLREESTRAL